MTHSLLWVLLVWACTRFSGQSHKMCLLLRQIDDIADSLISFTTGYVTANELECCQNNFNLILHRSLDHHQSIVYSAPSMHDTWYSIPHLFFLSKRLRRLRLPKICSTNLRSRLESFICEQKKNRKQTRTACSCFITCTVVVGRRRWSSLPAAIHIGPTPPQVPDCILESWPLQTSDRQAAACWATFSKPAASPLSTNMYWRRVEITSADWKKICHIHYHQ